MSDYFHRYDKDTCRITCYHRSKEGWERIVGFIYEYGSEWQIKHTDGWRTNDTNLASATSSLILYDSMCQRVLDAEAEKLSKDHKDKLRQL